MDEFFGSNPQEVALRLLTVVTFLGTAGIGLHALFHDYRSKRGRITRAGIVAAILLASLAAISIASELVRSKLESKKEAEGAALQKARFDVEMRTLHGVTRDLGEVSRRVSASAARLDRGIRNSLAQQGALLDRTDRSLRLSTELGAEARRDTANVLRRIAQESNRVQPEDVSIAVRYRCSPNESGRVPQMIMGDNITAVLQIGPPAIGDRLSLWFVELITRQQRNEFNIRPNSYHDELDQTSTFSDFRGSLGPLELLDRWRGVVVTASVEGPLMSSVTINDMRALSEEVSCRVTMALMLNGRRIAEEDGTFSRLTSSNYQATFRLPIEHAPLRGISPIRE